MMMLQFAMWSGLRHLSFAHIADMTMKVVVKSACVGEEDGDEGNTMLRTLKKILEDEEEEIEVIVWTVK